MLVAYQLKGRGFVSIERMWSVSIKICGVYNMYVVSVSISLNKIVYS